MYFDDGKRKTTNAPLEDRPNKRARMISCSNSDSGRSTMSGNSVLLSPSSEERVERRLAWPLLSLLTKTDVPMLNGVNRRRFPDPTNDK